MSSAVQQQVPATNMNAGAAMAAAPAAAGAPVAQPIPQANTAAVTALPSQLANPTVPTTSSSYPIASLYVGDLHTDVTEAMLYEKFSTCGPVLSIRVCRDLVTRRSLGYAYVNFQQPGDAERALDTMNFDELKSRPMRIMWSQRDPAIRKSGKGNIFIKNLDKSIDNKQLFDTFSQFGNILSCKIVKDDKENSKGYGFVHFESDESGQDAINQVNGMLLCDRKVFVGRFKSKQDRQKENGHRIKQFTNVYIKNLPDEYTEEQLITEANSHGRALSVKLMVDETGKSRCFGFASYATHEEADKLVKAMNEIELGGKVIYAGRAQKKAERMAELKSAYQEKKKLERGNKFIGVNLYVKNLDDTVTDEILNEAFAHHGTITSAKVMCDEKTGLSRGFGFVCFSSPEEATKAVTEMNGRIVGSKPLYVALAQRKEERRQHLATQYLQRGAGAPMARAMPGLPQTINPYGYPAVPGAYLPGYGMPGMPGPMPAAASMIRPNMNHLYGGIRHQMQGAMPGMRAGFPMPVRSVAPMNRAMGIPRQAVPSMYTHMQRPIVPNGMMGMPRPGFAQRASAQQFVQQARNVPSGQFDQQQIQAPAAITTQAPVAANNQEVPAAENEVEITAEMLAKAEPSEQKQMLGERIYPLVSSKIGQDLAGKVTGMLLEIENSELLMMIDEKQHGLLNERITEAVNVLNSVEK